MMVSPCASDYPVPIPYLASRPSRTRNPSIEPDQIPSRSVPESYPNLSNLSFEAFRKYKALQDPSFQIMQDKRTQPEPQSSRMEIEETVPNGIQVGTVRPSASIIAKTKDAINTIRGSLQKQIITDSRQHRILAQHGYVSDQSTNATAVTQRLEREYPQTKLVLDSQYKSLYESAQIKDTRTITYLTSPFVLDITRNLLRNEGDVIKNHLVTNTFKKNQYDRFSVIYEGIEYHVVPLLQIQPQIKAYPKIYQDVTQRRIHSIPVTHLGLKTTLLSLVQALFHAYGYLFIWATNHTGDQEQKINEDEISPPLNPSSPQETPSPDSISIPPLVPDSFVKWIETQTNLVLKTKKILTSLFESPEKLIQAQVEGDQDPDQVELNFTKAYRIIGSSLVPPPQFRSDQDQPSLLYLFYEYDPDDMTQSNLYMVHTLTVQDYYAERCLRQIWETHENVRVEIGTEFVNSPPGTIKGPLWKAPILYRYTGIIPTKTELDGVIHLDPKGWAVESQNVVFQILTRYTTPVHQETGTNPGTESEAVMYDEDAKGRSMETYWTCPHSKNVSLEMGKGNPSPVLIRVCVAKDFQETLRTERGTEIDQVQDHIALWKRVNYHVRKSLENALVNPKTKGPLEIAKTIGPLIRFYPKAPSGSAQELSDQKYSEIDQSILIYDAMQAIGFGLVGVVKGNKEGIEGTFQGYLKQQGIETDKIQGILEAIKEQTTNELQGMQNLNKINPQDAGQAILALRTHGPLKWFNETKTFVKDLFGKTHDSWIKMSLYATWQALHAEEALYCQIRIQDQRKESELIRIDQAIEVDAVCIAEQYAPKTLQRKELRSLEKGNPENGIQISAMEYNVHYLFEKGGTYLIRYTKNLILIHVIHVTTQYLEVDASVEVSQWLDQITPTVLQELILNQNALESQRIVMQNVCVRRMGLISLGQTTKIPIERGRIYIDAHFNAYGPEIDYVHNSVLKLLDPCDSTLNQTSKESLLFIRLCQARNDRNVSGVVDSFKWGVIKAVYRIVKVHPKDQVNLERKTDLTETVKERKERMKGLESLSSYFD